MTPSTPSHISIGVDVGGTKVLCAAFNANNELIAHSQVSTKQGEVEIVDEVCKLISEVINQIILKYGNDTKFTIGIGVPGLVNQHTGQVSESVNLGSHSIDFKTEIRKRFGLNSVIDNDVNAAAFGAYNYYGSDSSSLVFLNLGTGVSAGIIINGSIFHGSTGVAGEIGHIVADTQGRDCPCGQRGCVETIISGTGLSKLWPAKNEYPIASLLRNVSTKNNEAEKVWNKFISTLVSALQIITVTFDPEIIVIGGGVSKTGAILLQGVKEYICRLEQKSLFLSSLKISDRVVIADQEVFFGALGAALIGRCYDDKAKEEN